MTENDRETYLAHLLTTIGRIEAKIEQQLRSHDTLIQILMRSSTNSTPIQPRADHHAPEPEPTGMHHRTQTVDRILSIIPMVWQVILWMIPRLVIAWGLAEGWVTAIWHWLAAVVKHVL